MEQKFSKGSKEWTMFTDFWALCQKVWIPEHTDAYWENARELANEFIKEHKSNFARLLINALLKDIEERSKE